VPLDALCSGAAGTSHCWHGGQAAAHRRSCSADGRSGCSDKCALCRRRTAPCRLQEHRAHTAVAKGKAPAVVTQLRSLHPRAGQGCRLSGTTSRGARMPQRQRMTQAATSVCTLATHCTVPPARSIKLQLQGPTESSSGGNATEACNGPRAAAALKCAPHMRVHAHERCTA
jgi:hypothetical protein